jgi:hypothetical protein
MNRTIKYAACYFALLVLAVFISLGTDSQLAIGIVAFPFLYLPRVLGLSLSAGPLSSPLCRVGIVTILLLMNAFLWGYFLSLIDRLVRRIAGWQIQTTQGNPIAATDDCALQNKP